MKSFPTNNIPTQEVANYFLCKINEEDEEQAITKLKLQKLLYYAQGFVMAITEKKLFNADIYAWKHGPVIKEIFDKYNTIENNYIPKPIDCSFKHIEKKPEIRDILDQVYNFYGQFSAWKLRAMTHEETPWVETKQSHIINDEAMFDFFKLQVS